MDAPKFSWVKAAAAVIALLIGADLMLPPLEPTPAPPQPCLAVDIECPPQGEVGQLIALRAVGDATGWVWISPDTSNIDISDDRRKLVFAAQKAGEHRFWLVGEDSDPNTPPLEVVKSVWIGKKPEPQPEPTPTPTPTPTPVPTPGGISVALIEESNERTFDWGLVWTSIPLREYLEAHCEKGSKSQPLFFFTDDDVNQRDLPQMWKDALAAPRTQLPWVVVMGKGGKPILYSGPPPKVTKTRAGKQVEEYDAQALIDLLKKYGGA